MLILTSKKWKRNIIETLLIVFECYQPAMSYFVFLNEKLEGIHLTDGQSLLQLLRIEEELGDQAAYAGDDWRMS